MTAILAIFDIGASGLFYAPLVWASNDFADTDFYREFGRPYDLQLLQMFPDGLEEMGLQAQAMVEGTHPRAATRTTTRPREPSPRCRASSPTATSFRPSLGR